MIVIIKDVVVSLIAAGIIFVLGFLWSNAILPFIHNLLYTGIRIDGTWTIDEKPKANSGQRLSVERNTVVVIEQKANKLSGTATSTDKSNIQPALKYKVTGEIKDRIVEVSFRSQDSSTIAHSSFLMEVKKDGKKMDGSRNFYSRLSEGRRIDSRPSKWVKQ